MLKKIQKLSVWVLGFMLLEITQTGVFFSPCVNISHAMDNDYIIPLVYIKNMEYYNHTTSSQYTNIISEKMALIPEIIVTDDEKMADFYIIPKLLQSKLERLNDQNSKYSISICLEIIAKGGALVDREQKNRYIVVQNKQDMQEIVKKLMQKLLSEAIEDISLKIKQKKLTIGSFYFDNQNVAGPSLIKETFISA